MTGNNAHCGPRTGKSTHGSGAVATALLAVLLLGIFAPIGTAHEPLTGEAVVDPPIQHEVCPEEGAVLVGEKRSSTNGWVRLYQNHLTGDVYISWEFLGDAAESDGSVGIFERKPSSSSLDQEGHQLYLEEPSGYCEFVDSIIQEFFYQVYYGGGSGAGNRAYFLCRSKFLEEDSYLTCISGPYRHKEWLEETLCDVYPPGLCGPRQKTSIM